MAKQRKFINSTQPQKKGKIKEVSSSSSSDWFYSDKSNPAFSLKYIQKKYSIENMPDDEKISLINRLSILSKMSWGDIKTAPRHGLGQEQIKRDSFNVAIPDFATPDVKFLSLRYNGKKPFVGFRDGKIFYILWVDYNFSVYNHGG
jgi:hypothetical protein